MGDTILSWGRTFRFDQQVQSVGRLSQMSPADFRNDGNYVFHGMGRSYGDVALNENGRVVLSKASDNIIAFDRLTGSVKANSGLTLAELNKITIPDGWFVAVTPGTKFVTLGGAVANDVHGKNHHTAGSFGTHVNALMLVRSDGERLLCSRNENSEMFALTISGLGLTGYIEWVELQLKKIESSNMYVENIPYYDLDAFFALSQESADWPYTVAWIDCFSSGKKLGRGIFSRGKFIDDGKLEADYSEGRLKMPMEVPSFLLNRLTISAFNLLYRHRPTATFKGIQSYEPFFYPLDSILEWNKLYGRTGFYQHQSIIPMENGEQGMTELLRAIGREGQGSFLAVLKVYGKEQSPGLNSFPLEGVSLALDFANRGDKTRRFLQKLDDIVLAHGGRMYPAKDGLMSAETYQRGYPNWQMLEAARDPKISSSFWRRVTTEKDFL